MEKLNALFIAGESIHNKEWIESLEQNLRSLFNETKIHYHAHWTDNHDFIDLDKEVSSLKLELNAWNKYIVIAKSAGSIATLRAIDKGYINPDKIIIMGFPYNWIKERKVEVDNILKNISTKILFIQKTNDPLISFQDLKNYLIGLNVKNYTLEEMDGDDHSYDDLNFIKNLISSFIK